MYERLLSSVEIKGLYDDYKHHYQNIPLITDAIGIWDLTDPSKISYSIKKDKSNIIIRDKSGNDNEIYDLGVYEIEFVNNNSIKFSTPNNAMGNI
jgi:hypothetical protein